MSRVLVVAALWVDTTSTSAATEAVRDALKDLKAPNTIGGATAFEKDAKDMPAIANDLRRCNLGEVVGSAR